MTKQVTIRDEDYELARDLAHRLGASVDDTLAQAVREALRELGRRAPGNEALSPSQQADLDAIRALVEEAQKHIVPGAINDHGYLYDWNGLPA